MSTLLLPRRPTMCVLPWLDQVREAEAQEAKDLLAEGFPLPPPLLDALAPHELWLANRPAWVSRPPRRQASRLFNDAASDYLESTSIPVSAFPASMSAWIYPDDLTTAAAMIAVGLGTAVSTQKVAAIGLDATHNGWAVIADLDSGASIIQSTRATPFTVNTWAQIVGVLDNGGTNGVLVYVNGTAGTHGTDTPTVTWPTFTRLNIGANWFAAARTNFFSGRVTLSAIWNLSLVAGDVTNLQTQAPPFVQRDSLKFYAPLWGGQSPLTEQIGSGVLTASGTSVAADPTVTIPGFPWQHAVSPFWNAQWARNT